MKFTFGRKKGLKMDNKYEQIKSILKNGDICFTKTWDNNYVFGFYMDEYLYVTQNNGVVAGIGGFEQMVVKIERPRSMRNAFDCFKNGELYNCDVIKFGKFDCVYIEE